MVFGFPMCARDEFRCVFLAKCIPADKVCDGNWDCTGGMDEDPAFCQLLEEKQTCRPTEYQCRFGGCVSRSTICDSYIDCYDTSDETADLCANNKCSEDAFQCNYGACISKWQVCSGSEECVDGSDETSELCSNRVCPTGYFQCDYGACIPSDLLCDGRVHCADRSDEKTDLCSHKRKNITSASSTTSKPVKRKEPRFPLPQLPPPSLLPGQECPLPQTPDFGQMIVLGCKEINYTMPACRHEPDSKLPPNALVKFTCTHGHRLVGTSVLVCLDEGHWSHKEPSCLPEQKAAESRVATGYCPQLVTRKGVLVEYKMPLGKDFAFPADDDSVGFPYGTEARMKCSRYYVPSSVAASNVRHCRKEGKWTVTGDFRCSPECGKSDLPLTPFVTNGKPTNLGQWPWHTGLYLKVDDKFVYNCGGSLISENAIITAAHCVTKAIDSSDPQRVGNVRAVVGKYLRDYYEEEALGQNKYIRSIHVHPNYNPANYDSDLAVVILDSPVELNHAVRPVCYIRDLNTLQEEIMLRPGNRGKVVGWGKDSSEELSRELRMAELTVVSPQTCMEKLQVAFRSQVRYTTLCAVGENSTNVCNGDSGGGLVFAFGSDTDKRWYIQGIVSVGIPTADGITCDSSQFSFFTRVGKYADWIIKVADRADGTEEEQVSLRPMALIRVQVTVNCHALTPATGVKLKCLSAKTLEVSECDSPQIVGTGVSYRCGPHFLPRNYLLPSLLRQCNEDGSWSGNDSFACIPDCGKTRRVPAKIPASGLIPTRGQWPWHVGVYHLINETWEYACAATLISAHAVLTSAQCVTKFNSSEAIHPKYIQVLLGKHFREPEFEDPNVQISEIDKIYIQPNYSAENYTADLAILRLAKVAILGPFVKALCIPAEPLDRLSIQVLLREGRTGIAYGWGLSNSGSLTNEPVMMEASVVTHDACTTSYPDLADPTTFCTSFPKRMNACNGDIGTPLVMQLGPAYDYKWYLQGILSIRPESNEDTSLLPRTCNSREHAVFVRVANYASWIKEHIELIDDTRWTENKELDARFGYG